MSYTKGHELNWTDAGSGVAVESYITRSLDNESIKVAQIAVNHTKQARDAPILTPT